MIELEEEYMEEYTRTLHEAFTLKGGETDATSEVLHIRTVKL